MRRLAAALLLLGSPAAAQTTDAFAGIPGVRFAYYTVDGHDAAALRRSIDAAAPRDAHDGERVDALTHWKIGWRWTGTRHRCDLAGASVRFSATVTLPRLADPASLAPPLLAQWRRYMAALEAHESGHVRYAYEHRRDVLAAIRRARCATAAKAGQAALDAIAAHDLSYDRETRHGQAQGASFP